MRRQLLFIALYLFSLHASSQCTSPETEQLNSKVREAFQLFKSSPQFSESRNNRTPIIVPIVFHVVNNDIYVAQYSSDSTLYRLLNRLNVYYAKQNADTATIPSAFQPLASASSIYFCLAARDPNGNSTTGIIRVPSSHGPFYSYQANELISTSLGGDDTWPFNQYLNIYVCGTDAGHLGFASHGFEAVSYVGINGTTPVHETGHCFGLAHTFGGGPPYTCSDDDGISDTPAEWGPATGTPAYPLYDSCTTTGDGIIFMDMMDYAQQRTMFTAEQVALMEYTLATNSDYAAMIATNNCSTVEVEAVLSEPLINLYPNPAHDFFTLNLAGDLEIYDVMGRLVFEKAISQSSIIHLQLPQGIYFVKVRDGEKMYGQKLVIE